MLKLSSKTLQQVEKYKYLAVRIREWRKAEQGDWYANW